MKGLLRQHLPGIIVAVSLISVSYWLSIKDHDPTYMRDLSSVDGVIEAGEPRATPKENAIYLEGMKYLESGNYSEAEKQFLLLLAINPEDEKNYHILATCQVYMGKLDTAERNFKKALEYNPDYYRSYAGLGSIAGHRHNYPDGIPHFQKALQLQPNYSVAHWGLGIAYYKDHQYELAIKHFKRNIELTPQSKSADYSRKYLRKANERIAESER